MIYFRKAKFEDINRIIYILNQLSPTNFIDSSEDDLKNVWKISSESANIYVIVNYEDCVVGTGTLMVQPKILRGYSKVGFIEDVVVDKDFRGNGYGLFLMKNLVNEAHKVGCYKVILSCSDNNVKYYEKCGFHLSCNTMRKDLL